MALRAREVLKQVSVRVGRDDAEIEDEPIVRDDGGLRLPVRLDLRDPGELREVLGEGGRVRGGGDDVEVLDGLGAPPDRSGLGDLVARRVLAQHLDDRLDCGQRPGKERALLPWLRRLLQRLEDPLLGLGAEPRQRPELLGLRCLAEVLHGRDPEVLPDPAGGLWAKGREPEKLGDAGRDALLPLGQRLDLAGLDDLDDLRLDRLPDSRQVLRLAGERLLGDRAGRRADLVGRPTVRQHPELLLSVELEEVGEEVELLGHLRVRGSVVAIRRS